MGLIIHRKLAVPAAAAFFAVALTLPTPATTFAIAALGIAASASAMLQFRASRAPVCVLTAGPANQ